MNVVMWIDEHDIEVRLESEEVVAVLAGSGIRCYKSSKDRRRRGSESRFIRYKRTGTFSPVTYVFTDNRELFDVCMKLRDLGFVFWSNFKTERAPADYMRYLQNVGLLSGSFQSIEPEGDPAEEASPNH